PGMWKKVPGWLLDAHGPLSIPLRNAPRVARWLWRLHQATSRERVDGIADALQPMLTTTVEKWRPLAEWAGVPELIRQEGYAFLYESRSAFESDTLGRALRQTRGVAIDVLEGAAIRDFDPVISPRITHMVMLPEQGHCPNPLRLSQALANRLREHGVILSAQLGSNVLLETERGYHIMMLQPDRMPRVPIMSGEGKYFLTPMETGLRVAGTVELAGLDAEPNYQRADDLLVRARTIVPEVQWKQTSKWMGHRPSLPDSKPVVGRAPNVPNALFAFGHGHVGLTAAAPTAEIIADLAMGREPGIDIRPFAADRVAIRV
ncbi:MAG: FAD-binding oxidoreductase, partial [Betaproteobacteria bacterium]|nr:FAD-binding oxidoreductase [Betaproteobacteria bacterium]